jgi:small-conductance mechanosensitive channel
MEHFLQRLVDGSPVDSWIYTGIIFCLVLFSGLVTRRVLWRRLGTWALKSDKSWRHQALVHLKSPVDVLVVVAAFGIAGQAAPPQIRAHPLMVYGVKITLILVAIWTVDRMMALFFRSAALPESLTVTTRTLFLTISRAILLGLGLLIVLDTVGVSITPLLASLGVGSVAVALALQDTLSNFFGGLYLLIDKPIRLGDYVKIETAEGVVEKIGWRSTRIRNGLDNTVIVPNSKVSSAYLLNYDLPLSECTLTVDFGVGYEADLEQVERVSVEVAKEIQGRVSGAVRTYQPVARFQNFGDSAIGVTVVMRVTRATEGGTVKHEFIKALHVKFAKEGILFPIPQRMVHLSTPLQ